MKYFSGVSTWTSTFEIPKWWKAGAPLRLDLGQVGDGGEVRVNGTMVGTVWKAPWTVDVGAAAKSGSNTIEIRVANLWANRLIGDKPSTFGAGGVGDAPRARGLNVSRGRQVFREPAHLPDPTGRPPADIETGHRWRYPSG